MSLGPEPHAARQIADLERRVSMLERALIGMLANQSPASPTQTLSGPLPGPAIASTGPLPSPPPPRVTPPVVSEWLPVLHKDPRCQDTAQYVTRQLRPDEPPNRALLRVFLRTDPHPEWRVPTPDEIARCATCGEPIDPHSSADLDWSRAILPMTVGTRLPTTTDPAASEQQQMISRAMSAVRTGGFGHILDDPGYDSPE